MKVKIGILISEFENLPNWVLRIIKEIIENPKLELSLLVKDGRKGNESPKDLKNKIKRLIHSKNILGKLILFNNN